MIATLCAILKNGVIFDIKNWSRVLSSAEKLPDIIDKLFSILSDRKVDYIAVVGIGAGQLKREV